MSNYQISDIEQLDEVYLKEGVFLVLMHALNVPPHLLLIVSGKVFSISTLGPAVDEDVQRYLNLIKKKSIKTLFVKMNLPQVFTKEELQRKVREITLAYPRVDVGLATCLSPIKDFCHDFVNIDKSGVLLVFDLLDSLKSHQAIAACYHLNLESELIESKLLLKRYSVFEVNEAIFSASVHA